MSSQAVWRGDNPGFQTQAVGNYPAKSDVADQDNIFLTDQGWVYRHYKSLDKSKYWDEIIWAGYVNSSVLDNDPVDSINDPSPQFNVGDGIQFVSGVYPGADPTIGVSSIGGVTSGDTGSAIPFTVSVTGTLASGNTFAWSVDGPGTAVIGTASGTFSGNTPAEANTNITFPTAGTYNITCLIKSSATASTGSVANLGFTASATATDTIGTVSISGQATPAAGGGAITYTINYDGTAPEADITVAAFSISPTANATIATVPSNPLKRTITFAPAAGGTEYTITAQLSDTDASDSPQSGTKSVTPTAGTSVTYTTTVAAAVNGSGSNSYYLTGGGFTNEEAPALTLDLGDTIVFNQDAASNAGHPILIYTAEDKTGGAYTTGVTTAGTAGTATATVTFVPEETGTFYYQCSNHANMGNSITVTNN